MRVLDRWRSSTDAARFEAYTWWSIAVLLWIVPFFALGVAGASTADLAVADSDARLPLTRTWTVVVVVGAAALQTWSATRTARESWSVRLGRGTPRPSTLVLLLASTVLLVAVSALVVPSSDSWVSSAEFLALVAITAGVAAYGARWTFRKLVIAVVPAAIVSALTNLLMREMGVRDLLVMAVADGLVILGFGASVWLSAWMVEVVRRLEQARHVEGRLAVAEERLRFSRDLHDTVGRSLSAIAVKSELAAELARRGRSEAPEEMTSVRDLAHEALAEVRSVAAGYRTVSLTDELEGARSLLRSTGAVTTMTGDADGVGPLAQDVLAWVVREGVTNVVRHSSARAVGLTLVREEDDAVLTLVNDGATPAPGAQDAGLENGEASDDDDAAVVRGNGLAGLAERLGRIGGTLRTERSGRRFVLVARVPADATGGGSSTAGSAPSPTEATVPAETTGGPAEAAAPAASSSVGTASSPATPSSPNAAEVAR
ncbi:sensor histidine kinase [Georgenia sp. Z1491]|uniref:sensor histidine kinase n=1 Tax=Georgenia sp. Z1491 TaxID=3416707 RepID=UPI003CF209DA